MRKIIFENLTLIRKQWKCGLKFFLFNVLLTLQILDFLFSLNYDFKSSFLSKNFTEELFFLRIIDNVFLIYNNQNYCLLFWKVCFCIFRLSFIQALNFKLLLSFRLLLQTFSNKSSKTDYQWNFGATYYTRPHRLLLANLHTSPLKFHLSSHLVPVHKCNWRLLSDNC